MKETANIELYNQSYYEVMRDKNPEIADVMMPIILPFMIRQVAVIKQ